MNYKQSNKRQYLSSGNGFTLIEMMIAILLGVFLMFITVVVFSNIRAGERVQNGLVHVQEDGRIVVHIIAEEIRNAGFRKPVWNDPLNGYYPVTDGSVDGANGSNDVLQIMYQDDSNCRAVANTNIDPETGEPIMGYKRITFSVDDTENLEWTCEFGLTPTNLVAGFTNQDIVNGVESFQVLYGIDTDFPPDYSANSWSTAENIDPRSSVCLQSQYLCQSEGLLQAMSTGVPVAIKIGFLIASPETANTETNTQGFTVLDVDVAAQSDKKMRKLYSTTVALRNLTL